MRVSYLESKQIAAEPQPLVLVANGHYDCEDDKPQSEMDKKERCSRVIV